MLGALRLAQKVRNWYSVSSSWVNRLTARRKLARSRLPSSRSATRSLEAAIFLAMPAWQ